MKSKISLFNRDLVVQIFRSVGWIAVVQFLLLLFALPLKMLMMVSNERYLNRTFENLFQYHFEIQMISLIGVPVILAVFLFRYLHVKDSADFMHSLPIKRERLFHQYTLTGMVLLLTPIILTTLLVLILYLTFDFTPYFAMTDIYKWAGVTILLEMTLFMAGVFVAMFTGLSTVHAVLTYIFLLFPAGIYILVVYNLKFLFFGFPYDYFLNKEIEKYSPVLYAGVMNHQFLSKTFITIFLIVAIVLYYLSLVVYKKRKVEAVSQAIAFTKLTYTFKYGTAFCMMLLGGMYFGQVQEQLSWTIFGYVAGSGLGYFAAEMVLRKTWRVLGNVKGYLVFAVLITMTLLFSQLVSNQYEVKIPSENDIAQVHFSNSPYLYSKMNDSKLTYTVKEQENVNAVRKLHKEIIENKQREQSLINGWENMIFAYELKNGKKVVRQYQINRNDFENSLKEIYESEEYKRASNEIFLVKEQDVTSISVVAHTVNNKKITISDSEEIAELLQLLKKEALNEGYEEITNPRGGFTTIEILVNSHQSLQFEYKSTYKLLDEWFANKHLLNQFKITADEVGYVLVAKRELVFNDQNTMISPEELIQKLEKSGEAIKIIDKTQIDQFLTNSSSSWGKEYIAAFYFSNTNYPEFRGMDEKYLPEILK